MAKEYITAGFKFGSFHPIRKLFKNRDEAQWLVDLDNKEAPELNMQLVEVEIDDLSNQPPEIRSYVQEQLKLRSRTLLHRAGDEHLTLIHPLEADQVNLNEGDKMIRIDRPRGR